MNRRDSEPALLSCPYGVLNPEIVLLIIGGLISMTQKKQRVQEKAEKNAGKSKESGPKSDRYLCISATAARATWKTHG